VTALRAFCRENTLVGAEFTSARRPACDGAKEGGSTEHPAEGSGVRPLSVISAEAGIQSFQTLLHRRISPSDNKYKFSNSLFKGFLSKIKRTLRLFDGPALDGMGVYHRCSHITMAKQLLNRADVIIRLKQMAGKTVAKGMC
jgi:hypothetical protein